MTAAWCRWTPDENIIDHVRLSPIPIATLNGPDRAWVVAGLTAAGWTAEDTARQLKCSLRLIRQIRADPMFAVARYALTVREQLVRGDVRAADQQRISDRTIRGLQAEVTRAKNQRNQLIESMKRATA